jgi:hypothetical protein
LSHFARLAPSSARRSPIGEGCAIIPFVDVSLPKTYAPVADSVLAFIAEADLRIEQLYRDHVIPAFVPSDFERVFGALRAVADGNLATGERFCEWGCGIGANVGLASMLGFIAGGIEIEPLLIAAAREMANDFDLDAEFIHGSFVPDESDDCLDSGEVFSWLSNRRGQAPEDFGFGPADVDVFFYYPWTDEEKLIPALIDRHAGVGALLLTYHGGEDMRLRRKVADRASRRARNRRRKNNSASRGGHRTSS